MQYVLQFLLAHIYQPLVICATYSITILIHSFHLHELQIPFCHKIISQPIQVKSHHLFDKNANAQEIILYQEYVRNDDLSVNDMHMLHYARAWLKLLLALHHLDHRHLHLPYIFTLYFPCNYFLQHLQIAFI